MNHAELIEWLRETDPWDIPSRAESLMEDAADRIAALVVERDRQADQLAEIADVVSQARREADRMSPETALYVFSRIDGIARGA